MNSKLTNTKSIDSISEVEHKKNLLLQRMRGDDLGTNSNSISQVLKDPSSSIGMNEHPIFSESAPDLNNTTINKFPVKIDDSSARRSLNHDIIIREEVEKEINEEYEDKFKRLKKFTLECIQEYAYAHQKYHKIEMSRKQERLGIITINISGSEKWRGGTEVDSINDDIDELNKNLDSIKKLDHQKSEVVSQRRNMISNALKEKKAKLKQLEEERQDFEKELRLGNYLYRSEFKINQLLNGDKYSLIELIGIGGFSEVWKAFDTESFKFVAIKIQKMNLQKSKQVIENFKRHSEREVQILSSTKHKNVVSFYEKFYIGDNTMALVMEYCGGGDLSMMLRRRGRLPEKEAKVILAQVIGGLLALRIQENYVIHYDLKPANILFTEDESVKIADFGISKIVEGDTSAIELTSQGQGTFTYSAPETFQRGKVFITKSVDTWSLGIIFYEMLYGSSQPFSEPEKFSNINFLSNIKISEQGKKFISTCLEKDPTVRPELSILATNDEYIHPIIEELNL